LKSQSAKLTACYKIGAVICSLPRRRSARELGSTSCPAGAARLRRFELGAVSQHGVHDDGRRRASAIRALRIVDRLAIENVQSLSFSGPL
jgi:hypothetical protein